MMMHPAAVKTLRSTISKLTAKRGKGDPEKVANWMAAKF
jgi:CO dehydrogenase/acetyl-CoA synthase delta subunit